MSASFSFLTANLLIAGKGIYRLVKSPLSADLLAQADLKFGKCITLSPSQFVSSAGDKWINLWQFKENQLKKIGSFEAKKKITAIELLIIKEHQFLLFGDKFGDVNSINIKTSLRGQMPKQSLQGIKAEEQEEDKGQEEEQDASEKEFDSSAPARFLMGHMDSIVQLFLNEEKTLLYSIDRMNKIKVSSFPQVYNLIQVILPFTKKFQGYMYPLQGNSLLTHSQMECQIKIYEAKSGQLIQQLDTQQGRFSPILPSSSQFSLQSQDCYYIYGFDEEGRAKMSGKVLKEAKGEESKKKEENQEDQEEKCLVENGVNGYIELSIEGGSGLLNLNNLRRDNS